jgi:hypothetical protein
LSRYITAFTKEHKAEADAHISFEGHANLHRKKIRGFLQGLNDMCAPCDRDLEPRSKKEMKFSWESDISRDLEPRSKEGKYGIIILCALCG